MIRVLVVEDSAVIREFLLHLLQSDPEIQVIGTAENGEEALRAVEQMRPDVITMDVHMPKMNGLDATRRIMETRPTPIVIVSGTADGNETSNAFMAIEAGALAVLPRPARMGLAAHQDGVADLIQMLKLMAEVKVVRRRERPQREALSPPHSIPAGVHIRPAAAQIKLVAVGASTGGPPVLRCILSGLPRDFPAPILIVQHIASGFTRGLAEWLAQSSKLPVHLATQGEHALSGHVYVAPEGFHMKAGFNGQITLTREDPEHGLRPSASCLFRSVAMNYGQSALGVLLTGMGKDGAQELKLMKDKGGVTIAQDKTSSVVHGMPGEAIKVGAAMYVLSPEQIPSVLISLVGGSTDTIAGESPARNETPT